MAKNEWHDLMPRTRYELCEALNRSSGGHATLNPEDDEVIEYGMWLRDNPEHQAQMLFDLQRRVLEHETAERVLNAKLQKFLEE